VPPGTGGELPDGPGRAADDVRYLEDEAAEVMRRRLGPSLGRACVNLAASGSGLWSSRALQRPAVWSDDLYPY
jgi:hypothetical protein